MRIEAEFLELPSPFGVGVPQALKIDAAGKAPFDRCLDELRRKELVPFDIDKWTKVASERFPAGLPKPTSSDPTQWLFSGHPKASDAQLLVATARLSVKLIMGSGQAIPSEPPSLARPSAALASDGGGEGWRPSLWWA